MPPRPLIPVEAGCAHLAFWPVYPLGRKGKTTILKSLGPAFKGGGQQNAPLLDLLHPSGAGLAEEGW